MKKNLLLLIIIIAVYVTANAKGSKKNDRLFKSSFANDDACKTGTDNKIIFKIL